MAETGAMANAVMSAVADNAAQYLNAAKGAAKGKAALSKQFLSKKEQFGELLDGEKAEARRRPKRIVDGRLGGRRRIRNDVGSVDGAPAGESVAHAPLLLSSGRRA